MYRIDKFLRYYDSLKDIQMQIEDGVWVHAQPLPFHPGFFTKKYWQIRKDAKAVRKGRAIAVTWNKE
jgi:hypothetical protein